MKSSRSSQEWNDNCNKIKRAFGGYPDWWYMEIVMSGLLNKLRLTWNE